MSFLDPVHQIMSSIPSITFLSSIRLIKLTNSQSFKGREKIGFQQPPFSIIHKSLTHASFTKAIENKERGKPSPSIIIPFVYLKLRPPFIPISKEIWLLIKYSHFLNTFHNPTQTLPYDTRKPPSYVFTIFPSNNLNPPCPFFFCAMPTPFANKRFVHCGQIIHIKAPNLLFDQIVSLTKWGFLSKVPSSQRKSL